MLHVARDAAKRVCLGRAGCLGAPSFDVRVPKVRLHVGLGLPIRSRLLPAPAAEISLAVTALHAHTPQPRQPLVEAPLYAFTGARILTLLADGGNDATTDPMPAILEALCLVRIECSDAF